MQKVGMLPKLEDALAESLSSAETVKAALAAASAALKMPEPSPSFEQVVARALRDRPEVAELAAILEIGDTELTGRVSHPAHLRQMRDALSREVMLLKRIETWLSRIVEAPFIPEAVVHDLPAVESSLKRYAEAVPLTAADCSPAKVELRLSGVERSFSALQRNFRLEPAGREPEPEAATAYGMR